MIKVDDLIAEGRRWIGTPFVHQGRSRFGVDCIGLMICVRDACQPWPEGLREIRDYSRRPKSPLMLEKIQAYCLPAASAGPGIAILIKFPSEAHPKHIALCTGENMIHAYQIDGRVCEVGYRAHWLRWTHSFWKIPGVAY